MRAKLAVVRNNVLNAPLRTENKNEDTLNRRRAPFERCIPSRWIHPHGPRHRLQQRAHWSRSNVQSEGNKLPVNGMMHRTAPSREVCRAL